VTGLDRAWAEQVAAICQPVFDGADVGFRAHPPQAAALLWEAAPQAFAARFPDSEIIESYGDHWPPSGIDYWVYTHPDTMTVELSLEGWGLMREEYAVTGDAGADGPLIARRFAEVLRVPLPGS
jgi:hypothetical protein